MLGWHIIIFPEDSSGRAADDCTVAHWMTGLGGTDWLDEMVRGGFAEKLKGGGYPCQYAAAWHDLLPALLTQPQPYRGPVVVGEDYVMTPGWCASMNLNREAFARCQPEDRMLINCWDQS